MIQKLLSVLLANHKWEISVKLLILHNEQLFMNKKVRELFFFEQFCSISNIDPISVCQADPPYPDIIFSLNNKNIGVELTELNDTVDHYSKLNHIESQISEIIKYVEKKIRNLYPKGLLIILQFDISKLLTPKEKTNCCEVIFKKIIEAIPFDGSTLTINLDNDIIEEELNVWQISIMRIEDDYFETEVNSVKSLFIPDLNESAINEVILLKSTKKYTLNNINEFWLLIHLGNSTASEFSPVKINNVNKIKFDKVIILDVSRKVVTSF